MPVPIESRAVGSPSVQGCLGPSRSRTMTFPFLSRYANLDLFDDHLGHGARRTDSLTTTLDAPVWPSRATRTTAIC